MAGADVINSGVFDFLGYFPNFIIALVKEMKVSD